MRIVVLGASGQIGSAIYDGLGSLHEVVGTSRQASGKYVRFDPIQEDWSALGKVDVLINCIGQITASRQKSFHHIHVNLTKQILRHRLQIGNPFVIQLSALGASTQHPVEFLRTKGIADDLLLQHGHAAVIRPSIVCTPGTMIVKKMFMLLKLGRLFFGVNPVPGGFLGTRIQPLMPEDLVELILNICLTRRPGIIEAVGPQSINFRQLIQILEENINQKLRLIEVSRKVFDVMMKEVVSRLVPEILNWQQYQLIFQDNIADPFMIVRIIGRPLKSVLPFFRSELTYAVDRTDNTY